MAYLLFVITKVMGIALHGKNIENLYDTLSPLFILKSLFGDFTKGFPCSPIDEPLWFMRDLYVLFLFTPILLFFLRKLGCSFLCALMILLSNIVSKMKLLTNNKKKTDNNELPIYNDLLNIINNIAQNHDFQIIHVDNERSKEIINNIVSDINYIEINYFNKDIMLRYQEVTNSDNLDILIKKANNAYLNKKYELAIQLYKQILSLKDELNTEYYLKISKCYNKLGKNAQAKKYLKVINLIINNDKTEEKKKSY